MYRLKAWTLVAGCLLQLQACAGVGHSEEEYMAREAVNIVRSMKVKIAQRRGLRREVADVNGLVDGDEMLTEKLAKAFSDANNARRKRNIVNFETDPSSKWTLPIPYRIDPSIDSAGETTIFAALAHITEKTCIRFQRLHTSTSNTHILFKKGSSCVGFVGKNSQATEQVILLTDFCMKHVGEIVHLVAHSVGLWHQHQRPDRDDYVRVITENIQDDEEGDFLKVPDDISATYSFPYDYASIMHFRGQMHSIGDGITLYTNNQLYQMTIGQRVALSYLDAKTINMAYCAKKCPPSDRCVNGGYPDPNNCDFCLCTDAYSGERCESLAPSSEESCGGTLTATSTEQAITSPGYGNSANYRTGQSCTWKIKGEAGLAVQVKFAENFGVYCLGETCQHWVEILEYNNETKINGPRFCCTTRPTASITSSSDQVVVAFRTGWKPDSVESGSLRGFKLIYKTVVGQSSLLCKSDTCANNGTCLEDRAIYTCVCQAPYTGKTCTEVIPQPRCQADTCANSGTCVEEGDTYRCICQAGFKGVNCIEEVPKPQVRCKPEMCANNGSCVEEGATYRCICKAPFKGVNCTEADCGACGLPGGSVQRPCAERQCTVSVKDHRMECRGGWWWRRCRWRVYYRDVKVPCLCCDDAHLTWSRRRSKYVCVAVGFSEWSRCNYPCGGCGWQSRSEYAVVDFENDPWHRGYYGHGHSHHWSSEEKREDSPGGSREVIAIDFEYRACNFQKCSPDMFRSCRRRRYRWWCRDDFHCCEGYKLEGDTCRST